VDIAALEAAQGVIAERVAQRKALDAARAEQRRAHAKLTLERAFGVAILIGVTLGSASGCVSCIAEIDPWLGVHARLFCPLVCDGCKAPYEFLSWTTTSAGRNKSSTSLNVYCSHRDHAIASLDWMGRMSARDQNEPYRVPFGGLLLWASSVGAWMMLGLPLALLIVPWTDARARRRLPEITSRIAHLERQLAEPRGPPAQP
jgi:hypothetical protein